MTVLNYLKVCDNPLQDIPLMGVLRSPIVGCTSQELAELRIQYPDGLLYESVSAYAGENEIPEKELDPDKLKSELLNSNLRTDEKNSLNIKLKGFHKDCGTLIFDLEKQDVNSGGSGCGCSASVLCSHILKQMDKGILKKVLFVATGALMSPTSSKQGNSIPGIAHAVLLER